MPFPLAGAILGAAGISGLFGLAGSREQADSTDAATAEQRRQFDLMRQDYAPYRQAGTDALGRLNALSSGDMTPFETSPGYEFVRSEGIRDIGNSFAAGGLSRSGNALRALTEYNQKLASGEFGNWWNRQAGLAGVGQSATNASSAYGANAAGNIGNYMLAGGNARASGVAGVNNAIQSGIGNYLTYRNSGVPQAPAAPYTGPMSRIRRPNPWWSG